MRGRIRRLACLSLATASGLLEPGGSRIVGSCLVARRGNLLRLERQSEPGNVQSEWDLDKQCAPDYAGTIAGMARSALEGRTGPQKILLLGLGGGTMAADLLINPVDWRINITAVESDADVAAAAREVFFPSMFASSPGAADSKLSVAIGDALELVEQPAELLVDGEGFDVIIEDFAYEQPSLLKPPFWRALHKLAVPDGTLLVNTLFDEREQMDSLAKDLAIGGWTDVKQTVDRGLQLEPGEAPTTDPKDWRPRDNMILEARAS